MTGFAFQTILDEETIHFDKNLNRSVSLLLKDKKTTIAIAEPLTCGQVSERLTDLPGSSQFFKGSLVCYAPLSKIHVGRISPQTVKEHGWLSKEVTSELANNVRDIFDSDIGLAISGIAGPGNDKIPHELTGKVFISYASASTKKSMSYQFDGSRSVVRQKASQTALVLLKQWLTKYGHVSASKKTNT